MFRALRLSGFGLRCFESFGLHCTAFRLRGWGLRFCKILQDVPCFRTLKLSGLGLHCFQSFGLALFSEFWAEVHYFRILGRSGWGLHCIESFGLHCTAFGSWGFEVWSGAFGC